MTSICREAVLLNLRYNETVAKFANAAGVGTADHLRLSAQAKPKAGGGACTSIAFCTGIATQTEGNRHLVLSFAGLNMQKEWCFTLCTIVLYSPGQELLAAVQACCT